MAALERLPARLDTPLLFTAPEGGLLNLDNFRRREWDTAIEAAGIRKPARIYDLRSTFASNALAAGVTVFELAKIMGSSGSSSATMAPCSTVPARGSAAAWTSSRHSLSMTPRRRGASDDRDAPLLARCGRAPRKDEPLHPPIG
jgi:hypothetical protein